MLLSATLLFVIAVALSLLCTPLVCRVAIRLGAFDHPGCRKIHINPTPRLGGICVGFVSLVLVLTVSGLRIWGVIQIPPLHALMLPLLLGCTILFFVGLWDDLWSLSVGVKLIGQTIASLIPILWGIRLDRISMPGGNLVDLECWAFPVTFLWILFITNAFNLIDGLDGLASGVAIIASGMFAVLFLVRGDFQPALVLLVLIGVLTGFLWYNFHPAKIFLGDSGSLILGYVLAVTAVIGLSSGGMAWPIVVPLLVLGLPIMDTVFVVARRLIESLQTMQRVSEEPYLKRIRHFKRLFEADQQHIHHRLLARGFSHRGAVLVLYGFATILSSLAFLW